MSTEDGSIGFDPDLSSVVLIGSSRFPKDPDNLIAIPAVVSNVIDFERLLLDPAIIGVPNKNVVRLLDEVSITNIQESISSACGQASDLLLIYYAGHGLVSRRGELLLTSPNSTFADAEANCIHWKIIKDFILRSRATNKVVILDCCFSGRADELLGADEEALRQDLHTKGTAVLASSARNEPSMAPAGERRTAFTGALLTILEDGIDNSRPVISLNETFAGAQQDLLSRALPEPKSLVSENADDLTWARNRRTLGADANVIAGSEAVFRNIERRINSYLEARIPEQTAPIDHLRLPISPNRLLAITLLMLGIGFIEGVSILYLGAHDKRYDYTNQTYTTVYPRLIALLITIVTLFVTSFLLAFSAFASSRKPWKNSGFSVITPNPSWARYIGIFATLNVALVFVVSMAAISVEIFPIN
jgi:hypothetical protein